MTIKKVGFIGLGAMGTPMTKFLLKAGYDVKGYDVEKKRVSALAKLGLKPAKSAREAAKGRELVMMSLPNWDIVEAVVEGKDGISGVLRKGQIVMDCTTVPPSATRAMAQRMEKKGVHWMDVPVSGAANQAKLGNMVFMVGGKKTIFNRIKPVLDQVGKKTVYAGKSGDAAMLKLVVNHTLFLNQAAAVEGLTLGLKAGLDAEVVWDTLISGAAGSDVIKARGQDMLAGDFKPKGALWISIKDLTLALDSAKELGVMLPMGGLYKQFMLGAHHRGWDNKDATVVMRLYEELAGGVKRKAGKK
ncbi:MAG: NAD(P)-dependent oxidoreductase [Deltaproteobacteria bacterium]|nr:NAD(P)-dependent oxidoreductase [Deltaproteobacteria bacterium]